MHTVRSYLMLFVLLGLAFALGCSQSGSSTFENPVAATNAAGVSGSSSSSSDDVPTLVAAADKTVICHFDVDDEDPYDSIVILVATSSVSKHVANHGDCVTSEPVGTLDCSCP